MRARGRDAGLWRWEGVRGGGGASSACTRRVRPKAVGVRARVERTLNMAFMLVTPEVSQLEMSALKLF